MTSAPAWCALRENADQRARDPRLARRLAGRFIDTPTIRILDLAAGTGANLRALAPLLGEMQEWTLVDNSPPLLEEAAFRITEWADEARAVGDCLVLSKGDRHIGVSFRIAEPARAFETLLAQQPDLVTAHPMAEMASPLWAKRFAKAISEAGASLFCPLIEDGTGRFAPAHPLDAPLSGLGNGPASAARAAEILGAALRAKGFAVETARSPWRLGAGDATLIAAILDRMAEAARAATPEERATWRAFHGKGLQSLVIGHDDLFAYPG